MKKRKKRPNALDDVYRLRLGEVDRDRLVRIAEVREITLAGVVRALLREEDERSRKGA